MAESQSLRPSDPITVMITGHIKPEKAAAFERWLTGINNARSDFPGFLSVDVIRPEEPTDPQYVILVRFDRYDSFKTWQQSAAAAPWLTQLHDFVQQEPDFQYASGLELWFTRPQQERPARKPPWWKQVTVSVLAVYPLILCLNWGLTPLLVKLPRLVATLIVVIILSGLLAYPVMPFVTRLFQPWLYPRP
ncbi:antibiotic biosynthesis monooxygenase [Candidatus Entotheonella palauensis]|uniref:antibiotic biosynthesis monooxygenase n=1 Tax=Candidatus Entotheonella palauensis TaxID=93172 RepID=UPI000B7DA854|nr:antibiotic biosynthesis monooxygenase [Candidatus Entotheonella palauensis]